MRRRRLPPVLQERDFSLYWTAIIATGFAGQMMAVAVGWQVYAINESALDLGLIGLAQFLPLPLLALPAGHIADRLPRRLVYGAAIVVDILIALCLLVVTLAGATSLWPFLVLALAAGCASALGWPAARSLPPTLVPADLLASAMALRGIAFQGATIVGPAIGGLLFAARGGEVVYAVAAVLFVAALVNVLRRDRTDGGAASAGDEPRGALRRARFVRRTPVLFGAISLDLFAVLFGGAVALLPLFAKEHPRRRARRPRHPPQLARRRRARRRRHPRPPPDPRQRRADAVHRRGDLRRVAHRLRAVEVVPALVRGARRRRASPTCSA